MTLGDSCCRRTNGDCVCEWEVHAVVGLPAVSCFGTRRHHDVLCCWDARWVPECVFPYWQEVGVLSAQGRLVQLLIAHCRLLPTLSLGSPCAFMDGNKTSLMVLTSSGQLHSWYVCSRSICRVTTYLLAIQEREESSGSLPCRISCSPSNLLNKLCS
jgi:hypothetical protein